MSFLLSALSLVFCVAAQAEGYTGSDRLYDKRRADWKSLRLGDRYEWTLYQQPYSKANYGHRYEWTPPGLGLMSLCIEVDGETGGERYRKLADEQHCPSVATKYRWDTPYEGHDSRCVKVDVETNGKNFGRIVDKARCSEVPTLFRWEEKTISSRARCLEVDRETKGREFRRPVANHLCPEILDIEVAFGKKQPHLDPSAGKTLPAFVSEPNRMPASVDDRYEGKDRTFWENPEDLVEHVHRAADPIHHR